MKNIYLIIFGLLLNISLTAQIDLQNGLVAYYPFNGNANDESGNAINGNVNGATLTTDRCGNLNSAYHFNGSANYITLIPTNGFSQLNNPQQFYTISAWFKADPNNGGTIFSDVSEDGWFNIGLNIDGSAGFGNRTSDWNGTSVNSNLLNLNDAKWHLLTATMENSTMRIHVDGIFQNQTTTPSKLSSGGWSGGGVRIGVYYLPDGGYFNGDIDDVRIYNRVLNKDEISQLYYYKKGNICFCSPWFVGKTNSVPADTAFIVDRNGNLYISACSIQYGAISGNFTNSFIIQNSSATKKFVFNKDNAYITGTITENATQTELDNYTTNNLIIKDPAKTVVARFDEVSGNIYLKGNLANGPVVKANKIKVLPGETITLTITGVTSGQFQGWYTGSCNGTLIDNATSINVAPSVNTTYYAKIIPTSECPAINCLSISVQVYKIGDSYQGGIIAYFLQPIDPGYNASVCHGLIAAPSDQGNLVPWYNGTYIITGATATAIGTGNANTNAIVSKQGAGSYAAKLCYDLVLGGYSDWFLPSNLELQKVVNNRVAIGGFNLTRFYWTSSEAGLNYATDMSCYGQVDFPNKNAPDNVRAIRTF